MGSTHDGSTQSMEHDDDTQSEHPTEATATTTAAHHESDDEDHSGEFWKGGHKGALRRTDWHNHMYSEFQKYLSERASIEKKYADKLTKLSARWEERFQKLNFPRNGTLFPAIKTIFEHDKTTGLIHSNIDQRLGHDLHQKIAGQKKTHFHKSLGKYKYNKDMIKEYDAIMKPYTKAMESLNKSKHKYELKCTRLHDIEATLDEAKKIDSPLANTEWPKLNKQIDKARTAMEKEKAAYKKQLESVKAVVSKYQADMKAQFAKLQADDKERIAFATEVLAEFNAVISVTRNAQLQECDETTSAKIRSTDGDVDTSIFANEISFDDVPPLPTFEEWNAPPAKPDDGKRYQGMWFTKAGEKKRSRSHKRFFLLKETQLEYYAAVHNALPDKKKGEIPLKKIVVIQLHDKQINLHLPGRIYKVWGPDADVVEKWAKLISDATGVQISEAEPEPEPEPEPVVAPIITGTMDTSTDGGDANDASEEVHPVDTPHHPDGDGDSKPTDGHDDGGDKGIDGDGDSDGDGEDGKKHRDGVPSGLLIGAGTAAAATTAAVAGGAAVAVLGDGDAATEPVNQTEDEDGDGEGDKGDKAEEGDGGEGDKKEDGEGGDPESPESPDEHGESADLDISVEAGAAAAAIATVLASAVEGEGEVEGDEDAHKEEDKEEDKEEGEDEDENESKGEDVEDEPQYGPEHEEAAKRIQKSYRNFRQRKAASAGDGGDSGDSGDGQEGTQQENVQNTEGDEAKPEQTDNTNDGANSEGQRLEREDEEDALC